MNRIFGQSGFSLVELMIAMTLGLFVSAMAMQVVLTSSNTHRTVDAVSAVQDNARYSLYLLEKDLRMAGFTGCVTRGTSVPVTNTLKNSSGLLYDFSAGLEGFNNVSTLPASLSTALAADPAPKSGTDVLVMRGPIDNPVAVSKTNNSSQLFATLTGTETSACNDGSDRISGMCEGDILMVTDCAKARVFQLTNLTITGIDVNVVHSNSSNTPGNDLSSWGGNSAPESEQFDNDAEITRISTVIYYVAIASDSGLPALYRKEGNNSATLIADGVEDLQLEYGVDTNDNFETDQYSIASAVTDWTAVRSVRVHLHLISNRDNVLNEAQTFTYNGSSVTATDKRLHYALTNTVTLRNRVP